MCRLPALFFRNNNMSTDTVSTATRKTPRNGARRIHEIGELCEAISSQRRFNGDTAIGIAAREAFESRVIRGKAQTLFAQLDERMFACFGCDSRVDLYYVHTIPGTGAMSVHSVANVWATVSGSCYAVERSAYVGALKYLPSIHGKRSRSAYRSTEFTCTSGGVAIPDVAPTYWDSPLPAYRKDVASVLAEIQDMENASLAFKAEAQRTVLAYADALSAFPQARPQWDIIDSEDEVSWRRSSWGRNMDCRVTCSVAITVSFPSSRRHSSDRFIAFIGGPLCDLEQSPVFVHTYRYDREATTAGDPDLGVTPDGTPGMTSDFNAGLDVLVQCLANHVYVPAPGGAA